MTDRFFQLGYRFALALLLAVQLGCHEVQSQPDDGKRWGGATVIEGFDVALSTGPQIAFDPTDTAIVVWDKGTEINSQGETIFSNRHVSGEGWVGEEQVVPVPPVGEAVRPQLAVDATGNVVLVWVETENIGLVCDPPFLGPTPVTYDVFAQRYTPAQGWGSRVALERNEAAVAVAPQVGVDPAGNATAVWSEFDCERTNARWSRYDATSGEWTEAQPLETDTGGDAVAPQIAVSEEGSAIAVWRQSEGERYSIWARRYVPAAGWSTPRPLEDDPAQTEAPHVAMDPHGNAVAVWQQGEEGSFDVWGAAYIKDQGWLAPERIENEPGDTRTPRVALDAGGRAIAIWVQADGVFTNVYANRYSHGLGWGRARIIGLEATAASSPRIAVSPDGDAVAVWVLPEAVRSSRYVAGFWGAPEQISLESTTNGDIQIALDQQSNAIAVWSQTAGEASLVLRIWSNRLAFAE